MEKLNSKHIRKIAFAIGFGLTLGRSVAVWLDDCVTVICRWINKLLHKRISKETANGDKLWQSYCEEFGVEYESKEPKNEIRMGFRG